MLVSFRRSHHMGVNWHSVLFTLSHINSLSICICPHLLSSYGSSLWPCVSSFSSLGRAPLTLNTIYFIRQPTYRLLNRVRLPLPLRLPRLRPPSESLHHWLALQVLPRSPRQPHPPVLSTTSLVISSANPAGVVCPANDALSTTLATLHAVHLEILVKVL